jgi:hypothetical protein
MELWLMRLLEWANHLHQELAALLSLVQQLRQMLGLGPQLLQELESQSTMQARPLLMLSLS